MISDDNRMIRRKIPCLGFLFCLLILLLFPPTLAIAKTGYLTVKARPEPVQITIDGIKMEDATEVGTIYELRPGTHTVHAEKEHFESQTEEVEIQADRFWTLNFNMPESVNFNMPESTNSNMPESTNFDISGSANFDMPDANSNMYESTHFSTPESTNSNVSGSTSFRVRKPDDATLRKGYGSITIVTDWPGATVFINGQKIEGEFAPITIEHLAVGEWEVTVTCRGKTLSKLFVIKPNQLIKGRFFFDENNKRTYVEEIGRKIQEEFGAESNNREIGRERQEEFGVESNNREIGRDLQEEYGVQRSNVGRRNSTERKRQEEYGAQRSNVGRRSSSTERVRQEEYGVQRSNVGRRSSTERVRQEEYGVQHNNRERETFEKASSGTTITVNMEPSWNGCRYGSLYSWFALKIYNGDKTAFAFGKGRRDSAAEAGTFPVPSNCIGKRLIVELKATAYDKKKILSFYKKEDPILWEDTRTEYLSISFGDKITINADVVDEKVRLEITK